VSRGYRGTAVVRAGSFVEPSRSALDLVRKAAKDHKVVRCFQEAEAVWGTLKEPDGGTNKSPRAIRVRSWPTREMDGEVEAHPCAIQFLLGMAITVALQHPIGYHSEQIRWQMRSDEAESGAEDERWDSARHSHDDAG
jgi:hypothetical protein